MNQILIYVSQSTPRVEYIFSTLFQALGITDFRIITDTELYKNSISYKLNYSELRISSEEFLIKPASLLFSTGIEAVQLDVFEWKGLKAFFQTDQADLPFDIFAASFYLLTRYEEYLDHKLDMYGRYAYENSIAYKEGFLNVPLVNLWIEKFREELKTKFPAITFQPPTFTFIPTYDIDIAWSYRNKGFIRNIGGFAKSFLKGDLAVAKERLAVLQGKQPDPFDRYGWLHKLHEENHLHPIYFFLVAEKNKRYDKNILPSNVEMQQLIKEHAAKYTVGIHPSWQSGDNDALLIQEKSLIEKIAGTKVTKSRQHYIRMKLPDTYKTLIEAGITEDFSMGYGSINGFRASYCLPYKWYDLKNEQPTNLILFPFCFMDANSYYEQHITPEEAIEEFKHYHAVTKQVNGSLITIWHNHLLETEPRQRGLKEGLEIERRLAAF